MATSITDAMNTLSLNIKNGFIAVASVLKTKINAADKGVANGFASLGSDGRGLYTEVNAQVLSDIAARVTTASIVDNLTTQSASVPLSANQGYVLAQDVAGINTILQSNDSNLTTIQQIVAYIKQEEQTLQTLSIAGIAGLQDALDTKATVVDMLDVQTGLLNFAAVDFVAAFNTAYNS